MKFGKFGEFQPTPAGIVILTVLRDRGSTVTWLARRMQVHHITLYQQLTGRRRLRQATADAAAEVLGIPRALLGNAA
ncbi:MAG: hypothetical protein IT337_10805 [Thermomicrobiales bacterium]|nr:hypothetical protein [Thermomicrobiales bacterium]